MKIQLVPNELSAKIKVLGIGGAGGNAINDMITSQMVGVDFIAANTDAQALERSLAPVKIQLGANVTRGLGAGGDPEIGKKAAMEDAERLQQVLQGADMVFIAAGMGGGTGTGGAPVVAELSRELGSLTVAVVSKPFEFEGKMKRRLAENGIDDLRKVVDTIITIPNDRLFSLSSKNSRIKDVFGMANEVLGFAVRGISDLIMVPGFINVDFADVRTVMKERGMALMGTGIASGGNRAGDAAQKAISSPLLEDISIRGARGILINITRGHLGKARWWTPSSPFPMTASSASAPRTPASKTSSAWPTRSWVSRCGASPTSSWCPASSTWTSPTSAPS